MKAFLMIAILALSLLSTKEAKANLFYDSCVTVSQNKVPMMFGPGGATAIGLTCEQIRTAKNNIEILNLTLIPAFILMKTPYAQAILGSELAALGLTMANPVVLSVTVVGAIGVTTVYLVLRQSMEECEREDREALKASLIHELEKRYNLKASGSTALKIQK